MKNIQSGHLDEIFLYHIFINKPINKLVEIALTREKEVETYLFKNAI